MKSACQFIAHIVYIKMFAYYTKLLKMAAQTFGFIELNWMVFPWSAFPIVFSVFFRVLHCLDGRKTKNPIASIDGKCWKLNFDCVTQFLDYFTYIILCVVYKNM